ncbi:MAG: hypothetical protein KTR31_10760 [Myxococcales bacterium]|nr:hypothetical protein [Myxococcales bacterium]
MSAWRSVLGAWLWAACAPQSPAQEAPALQLGPAFTVSDADVDAHHGAVAWLDERTLATTWTSGDLGPETRIFVRLVDPVSTVGEPIDAVAADLAPAKADPVVDADGRLWLGFQTELDGVWVLRHTPGEEPPNQRVQVAAQSLSRGNNSVDLALRADGGVDLVWYALQDDDAEYRFSSVQGDAEQVLATPITLGVGATNAAGTADVASDGAGTVATAFPELQADGSLQMVVRYRGSGPASGAEWRYATDDPAVSPRRASLDFGADGRLVVALRLFALSGSPQVVVAGFDADGTVSADPLQLPRRFADRPSVVRVGRDRVVLAFEGRTEDVTRVLATALSFPELEVLGQPVVVSDGSGDAIRPQLAASPEGQVAVVWEQTTAAGPRVVRTRTLTLAPPSAPPAR